MSLRVFTSDMTMNISSNYALIMIWRWHQQICNRLKTMSISWVTAINARIKMRAHTKNDANWKRHWERKRRNSRSYCKLCHLTNYTIFFALFSRCFWRKNVFVRIRICTHSCHKPRPLVGVEKSDTTNQTFIQRCDLDIWKLFCPVNASINHYQLIGRRIKSKSMFA